MRERFLLFGKDERLKEVVNYDFYHALAFVPTWKGIWCSVFAKDAVPMNSFLTLGSFTGS